MEGKLLESQVFESYGRAVEDLPGRPDDGQAATPWQCTNEHMPIGSVDARAAGAGENLRDSLHGPDYASETLRRYEKNIENRLFTGIRELRRMQSERRECGQLQGGHDSLTLKIR